MPALTLFEESYLKIKAEKLRALHELSQADVVASLKRLQKPLKLNRGVAENLLKIHQFTQLCGTQRFDRADRTRAVPGRVDLRRRLGLAAGAPG